MKRINILITGGAKFIGKNLRQYFSARQNKYKVYAPSREELDLLDADAVRTYFLDHLIDVIINCAVVGSSRDDLNEKDITYKNLSMFFNLERCLSHSSGLRMIHIGSGAVYDTRHLKPRLKEEDLGNHVPIDEYGFSKYICSKYILSANKDIIELIPFSMFGKYERYHLRFVSRAIIKNIFDLPFTINQDVYFDFIYIEDFVRIVEYFIDKNIRRGTFNVCTSKPINLLSAIGLIDKISGRKTRVELSRGGLGSEYSGDNAKLMGVIEGFKFTPPTESIEELYLWYKNNLDKIDIELVKRGDKLISEPRDPKL